MSCAWRRLWAVSSCVAALAALPAGASAQGLPQYLAPIAADDLAGTERAQLSPHLGVGTLFAARWVTALRDSAVTDQASLLVAAQLGLWNRLQLGVGLPVVLTQSGAEAGLGDARVGLRVRLAGPARGGLVRLAAARLRIAILYPVDSPHRGDFEFYQMMSWSIGANHIRLFTEADAALEWLQEAA